MKANHYNQGELCSNHSNPPKCITKNITKQNVE